MNNTEERAKAKLQNRIVRFMMVGTGEIKDAMDKLFHEVLDLWGEDAELEVAMMQDKSKDTKENWETRVRLREAQKAKMEQIRELMPKDDNYPKIETMPKAKPKLKAKAKPKAPKRRV